MDCIGSSASWSEARQKRKPCKNFYKWFSTDANRPSLGPLPSVIREDIGAYWALSYAINDNFPDTFMTITSAHLTGVPFASKKMCDIFREAIEIVTPKTYSFEEVNIV